MKRDVHNALLPPWAGPPLKHFALREMLDYLIRFAYYHFNCQGMTDYEIKLLVLNKGIAAGMLHEKQARELWALEEYEFVQKQIQSHNLLVAQRKARNRPRDSKTQKRLEYWSARLPFGLALLQTSWERRHAVARVYLNNDISLRTISVMLDITPERVRQMLYKALREWSHPLAIKRGYPLSPVERYFIEPFYVN
jgi:hypothetical protein